MCIRDRIKKGQFPRGINNLRLGEAVILGNETAYGERIPGTHGDGVVLEAQIVEVKTKRSLPVGEIGVDAFGRKPVYQDRGMRKRAILAVGRQDVDVDGITPVSYTHLDVYKRQDRSPAPARHHHGDCLRAV